MDIRPKPLRLRRLYQALIFDCPPDVYQRLAPLLTMTVRVTYHGEELRKRKAIVQAAVNAGRPAPFDPEASYEDEQLFLYEKGVLQTSAGMYARVSTALDGMGVAHEYVDERERPGGAKYVPPPFNFANLATVPNLALRYRQDELLALIFSLRTPGTINVTTGYGKSFLTKLIKIISPTARIALVLKRGVLVQRAYEELSLTFGPSVCKVQACSPSVNATLFVVSADSFHRLDPLNLDYILFDEVHMAAADNIAMKLMARPTNAQFIGFSATAHDRADGRNMRVEYMFGPIVMDIGHEEAEAAGIVASVEVYFEPVPPTLTFPRKLPENKMKRERICYQVHRHRNQLVAAAVRKHLAEMGEDTQVIVSTTRTEHAYYLGQLLPEFRVVHGVMSEKIRIRLVVDKVIPPDFVPPTKLSVDAARRDFESGKLRRVIATDVFREGVDSTDCRLLVRADGASGNVVAGQQWGGRTARMKTVGEGKISRIVDFRDMFDEWAEKRSKARAALYKKRGFKVIKW
jgi:superfamily II DNA or RNA helicase